MISMALIAALWLYASFRNGSPQQRLPWVGMVSLLLIAAAASTSRTGLLEIVAIVGVAAFAARRERQAGGTDPEAVTRLPAPPVLLSWIPLYFAIAWLLPQLAGSGVDSMVQRLSEGAPVGHSRLILWNNVLTLIAERPWTGWGWGELSFAHYMHSTLYPGGTLRRNSRQRAQLAPAPRGGARHSRRRIDLRRVSLVGDHCKTLAVSANRFVELQGSWLQTK